jgi:hypothetical protein
MARNKTVRIPGEKEVRTGWAINYDGYERLVNVSEVLVRKSYDDQWVDVQNTLSRGPSMQVYSADLEYTEYDPDREYIDDVIFFDRDRAYAYALELLDEQLTTLMERRKRLSKERGCE